jgi:ankyrin repeat protein
MLLVNGVNAYTNSHTLCWACGNGNIEMVKMLIDHGQMFVKMMIDLLEERVNTGILILLKFFLQMFMHETRSLFV